MMKKLNVKKVMSGSASTYLIIVVAYILIEVLRNTGNLSSLLEGLLVPLCTYVILAISLNLVVGILGELSLGHAGFMCVGAFSSAFFSKLTENTITTVAIRFGLALVVGAVCAALFGILIGIPVLRLKGDYLAIVTLAFGEIIKNVMNVLCVGKDSDGMHFAINNTIGLVDKNKGGEMIIKGAQGITGTPNDSNFTIGVVLILISIFIVTNLIKSRSGRAIMAIRDNRIAAESVGIDVTKYKLLSFTISAGLAGIAGVLYAHNLSTLIAQPKNFGYNMSIMILVFVVLGGIGNIKGSIIAAILLTVLPELLRFMKDYRMLIYAILLIVMMLFNWSPKCKELRERYSIKRLLRKKKEA